MENLETQAGLLMHTHSKTICVSAERRIKLNFENLEMAEFWMKTWKILRKEMKTKKIGPMWNFVSAESQVRE